MGRKKKDTTVEGITIDLDLSEGGDFVFEFVEEPKPSKKRKGRKSPTPISELLDCIRECEECTCRVYNRFTWKGNKLCFQCRQKHVDILYLEFSNFIRTDCQNRCAFCYKEYGRYQRFHFDHINMFSKEDSIGDMLLRGEEIEKIMEEAKKCQLLCYSCHMLVTNIEIKYGFIAKKAKINRLRKKGEQYNELLNDYFKHYDVFMTPIYEQIKETMRGSG